MRVLQLIDSLRSGGAERMAVNYANALAKRIDGSYLCCTRIEGLLLNKLSPEVGYLFLKKKRTLDLQAFEKLRKFVKANKVDLIQAHSSSWFLALMVKWSLPKVKLVWHDHYGRELKSRRPGFLVDASRYFNGVISVNTQLQAWSKRNLNVREVKYFPNFLPNCDISLEGGDESHLRGIESFRIVCLANFRPQKAHLHLLKAFRELVEMNYNISLHLVGKYEQDDYSHQIKIFIRENNLENKVFIYGEQENVEYFLKDADLGVLSSVSEGLPMALLEYGRAGLPVVCTKVGECVAVLGRNGKLVSPADAHALAAAMEFYIKDEDQRRKDAAAFKEKVEGDYGESIMLPEIIRFYAGLKP